MTHPPTWGSPGKAPAADARPVSAADIKRWQLLLKACWRSFDAAVEAAKGKTLTTGPRGGGRDLEKMVEHVLGGEEAYVSALGWKFKRDPSASVAQQMQQVREATLAALGPASRGELPAVGPRGGKHWSAVTSCGAWPGMCSITPGSSKTGCPDHALGSIRVAKAPWLAEAQGCPTLPVPGDPSGKDPALGK